MGTMAKPIDRRSAHIALRVDDGEAEGSFAQHARSGCQQIVDSADEAARTSDERGAKA